MFNKILVAVKGITNYYTILMIIAVGFFTLLIDGRRYKQKGYIRELKIVKAISYSYMAIGGLMFILLLMM